MSHRRAFQFQYSLERDLFNIYAIVTIGAAGAPTLESTSKGIKSVTRSSAGDYVVNLSESYYKLMFAEAIVKNAAGIPVSSSVGIKADSSTSTTAPSVELVFSGPTAAGNTALIATDPASGDKLFIKFIFRNAST